MSWITIDEYGTSASGKTKRWVVRSTEGAREELGRISWYPFWRKYAFLPLPLTVYEESCLRDIATFCESETRKHKVGDGEPSPAKCTCAKDGSAACKFPHPCRSCYNYHPGVSCYWHSQGKTPADKRSDGRTFVNSAGRLGCAECCNGDRCDDPTHRSRDNCPYCLGSGESGAAQEVSPPTESAK